MLAEATLTLVLFADASRIDLRLLRREVDVPVRLLGIGLPLTIAAGTCRGRPRLSRTQLARGARARDRPRTDRRGARPGGGHGQAPAVESPPEPERRERSQRRHLRPAALHRARDRGGGRAGDRRWSRGAHRRRGDRLRHRRRRRSRSRRRTRPAVRGATAAGGRGLASGDPARSRRARVRPRRSARRQRVHRRLRRRPRLRRLAPPGGQRRRRI